MVGRSYGQPKGCNLTNLNSCSAEVARFRNTLDHILTPYHRFLVAKYPLNSFLSLGKAPWLCTLRSTQHAEWFFHILVQHDHHRNQSIQSNKLLPAVFEGLWGLGTRVKFRKNCLPSSDILFIWTISSVLLLCAKQTPHAFSPTLCLSISGIGQLMPRLITPSEIMAVYNFVVRLHDLLL